MKKNYSILGLIFGAGIGLCVGILTGKMKLTQLYNTIFSTGGPIGIVEIKKDNDNKVLGLTLSNGRTRNVWFKKVNF